MFRFCEPETLDSLPSFVESLLFWDLRRGKSTRQRPSRQTCGVWAAYLLRHDSRCSTSELRKAFVKEYTALAHQIYRLSVHYILPAGTLGVDRTGRSESAESWVKFMIEVTSAFSEQDLHAVFDRVVHEQNFVQKAFFRKWGATNCYPSEPATPMHYTMTDPGRFHELEDLDFYKSGTHKLSHVCTLVGLSALPESMTFAYIYRTELDWRWARALIDQSLGEKSTNLPFEARLTSLQKAVLMEHIDVF